MKKLIKTILNIYIYFCKVAVKILEKEKLVEKEDLVHVWREIKILKSIEHNHIT